MIERANYLAVRKYIRYQAEVLLRSESTVERKWNRLRYLLEWCGETPFEAAPSIRPVFPRWLASTDIDDNGQRRTCLEARSFLAWLSRRWPRQYSFTDEWIETIRPVNISLRHREHQAVTLEQVRKLLALPADSLAVQREQAAAAMLFLSGMRARAFVTMPLAVVDMIGLRIDQDPGRGVETKNRKAITTTLLPIDDLIEVVGAWDRFVRKQLPPSALWWPVLRSENGVIRLADEAPGASRDSILRRRIAALFRRAGMEPMSPHKFRHGHAVYALKQARTVADLKAISMNLGHASLGVTDSIYAVLSDRDVAGRIAGLSETSGDDIEKLIELLKERLL